MENLAVAEHADHNIHFIKVKILNKEQNYGKRIIKEAIKIDICTANLNREDG